MTLKVVRTFLILIATAVMIPASPDREGVAGGLPPGSESNGTERRGRVLRYKLNNGLTVILKENRFSPAVALMVWVKAGSAVEEPGEYGLAHVHEHMLFKGTTKRGLGEIAGDIEAAGGDMNAYTSVDETAYYMLLPSRHVGLGLDVLSDIIFNSKFDSEELQKELQVVLEEIKRGEDSPTTMLSHALFRTAYKVHPYGRPIIGNVKSVKAFTRQDVIDFYNKWYTPENIVLTAVGDFDNKEMQKLVKKYFGIPRRGSRKASVPKLNMPVEPVQRKPRFKLLRGDVSESYLEAAFHIPNVNDEDIAALDILSYILGSGEASRLYRRVQSEQGLVNRIHSYTFTPRYPGVAMVGATLSPDKFKPALEAILKEIAILKSEPPLTEEINRAKTNIESESVYSRETVQGEARKLGFYEVIAQDIDFEEKFLRAVEFVSAEDIMRVARKYFTPENITVAGFLPESARIDGLDNASLETLVQAALTAPPAVSKFDGVKKVVLANGMTVLIKERHDVPVVAYRLAMLGGIRLEPPDIRGISNFIARTITKGTAKRSASEIAAEVENLAGSISGFSGRDSTGIQAEFLSKNYARGFEIFADVALYPMFNSNEVEQQRREIVSDIKRMKDRPDSLTIDLFRKTLFKTHPYGSSVLGKEKTVTKIQRRDLSSYYRNLLIPNNMVLSVVGDVSTGEMLSRIEQAFGDIPTRTSELKSPPKEKPLSGVRRAQIKRDKAQAQIVLGFIGPPLKSEDRYPMDVLSNILGGHGGRLFLELRDKLHLAYAVGAVSVEALDAGIFFMYMGTSPENRDEAVNGLLREIELISNELPGEEELSRAREHIAGSYEIGMQTAASQAVNLALNECYGLGWELGLQYPDLIRKVTAEDVNRVAKKYLKMNKYVIAELVPDDSEDGQDH